MQKSSLVLSLFILIGMQLSAQIKITKADMPKANDTIRYSETNNLGNIEVEKTGENHFWDFRSLTPNGQGIYEYKASLSTPYILNFGFSAIGLKVADTMGFGQLAMTNVFDFYKSGNSKFEGIGMGFQMSAIPLPQAGKHSDPDEIYFFPLENGDEDTSTYSLKIPFGIGPLNVGSLIRSGTRMTEVDGWGKISTPYDTGISCIRVKSVIDGFDSIALTTPPINFGFESKRIEYKWLSNTERIPILEIIGTETFGRFTPQTIRYRDKFREIVRPGDLDAQFYVSGTAVRNGDKVTLFDTSQGFFYQREWDLVPSTGFNYVDGTDENSEEATIQFTQHGEYTVKLRIWNFRAEDSLIKEDHIDVAFGVGIEDLTEKRSNVWPIPATEVLVVDFEREQSFECALFGLDGSMVHRSNGENKLELDVSALASGQYILQVVYDGKVENHKIIIQ